MARAAERLVLVARGVDEKSLVVPEAGHLALRAAYESNLRGYRDGGQAGVHAWLLYAAEAYAAGAEASPLRRRRVAEAGPSRAGSRSTRVTTALVDGCVDMRTAPGSRVVGRMPPLTRETDGYQACMSQLLPREYPDWPAPCRKGRSPRGYPAHVQDLEFCLPCVRRSRRSRKG